MRETKRDRILYAIYKGDTFNFYATKTYHRRVDSRKGKNGILIQKVGEYNNE